MSATFVSARVGWLLGVVPAGAGTELAVAHTTDGGGTWSELGAPKVTLGTGGTPNGARISFANPTDGWIVAPPSGSTDASASTLWSTRDGGASWHQVAVPGGGQVAALAASNGIANLATFTFGTNGPAVHLFTTPPNRGTWVRAAVGLPIGAGPVPSAHLSLHGPVGWLVENDRTVVAGARLSSGTWRRWAPPCTDANGLGFLAASTTTDLVAVCDEGAWGPPAPGTSPGPWLFASDDAGDHFAAVGKIVTPWGNGLGSSVAAPPGEPQVAVVGGPGLAATFDGGQTWRTVYRAPAGRQVRVVGFTTASQGVAIVTGGTTTSTLLMTHDGGTTWNDVALSSRSTS